MFKYRKGSTFGLLFRFFIPKGTDEKRRLKMLKILENSIINSLKIIQETGLIKVLTILIPRDENQATVDDGRTYKYLTEHLFSNPTGDFAWFKKHLRKYQSVFDLQIVDENAGLNTGLLNYGFCEQIRRNIDYTICVSTEYFEFLNKKNLQAIHERAHQGARVIQFASNRVATNQQNGFVNNVFMAWHNKSVGATGLFGWYDIPPKRNNHKVPYRGGDGLMAVDRIMHAYENPFLAYFDDQSNGHPQYHSAQPKARERIKLEGVSEIYAETCKKNNIDLKKLESRIIH